MFWAFALVCSAHDRTSPIPDPPVKILDHSPGELARLGAISMTLTLVNIIIIFIMGCLVLKVSRQSS